MAALPWVDYTVSTRASLSAGSWTAQPHLQCTQLTRVLGPAINQAILVWPFGHLTREAGASSAYVAPLGLRGQFVRIEAATLSIDWVGFVLARRVARWPQEDDGGGVQRIVGGDESYTAVGLEWFLGREPLLTSFVHAGNEINRAIGFNVGWGEGRDLTYADRGNKHRLQNQFAADKNNRELWTADSIVDYLLFYHNPKDKDGNIEPVNFVMTAGSAATLSWYTPIVKMEGRTVLQLLNEIISPRRGLVWWCEWNNGAGTADIQISSMATAQIPLTGDSVLPAARTITALADVDDQEEQPQFTWRNDRKYGRVIVRGARRRAVFTVAPLVDNLVSSWRLGDEIQYIIGLPDIPGENMSKINDRYRQANMFERVYQMWQIPDNWDGQANDGSAGQEKVFVNPEMAMGHTSPIGGETLALPGLRLLRTMPLRVGYDYDDAGFPTARDPLNTESEWQRPFAVIDVNNSPEGEPMWRFMHKINTIQEADGKERKTSYHLRVLKGTPGIQLSPNGGMPHSLAKNEFGGVSQGPTGHNPEVNWHKMRVTVCAEWDAYCEAYAPTVLPDDNPLETLYISLGDRARLDYLAFGTIYDVQDNILKTCTDDGPLRDDRDICQQVAIIAYDWYGVDRATFSMSIQHTVLPVDIGTLISTVGTAEAQETVNATVNRITHNLEAGTTQFSAGFSDMDFKGLL